MRKFYVESGRSLRVVLAAANPIDAVIRAVMRLDDEILHLGPAVVVSERGFPSDRADRRIEDDELVLPTRLLLGDPQTTDSDADAA